MTNENLIGADKKLPAGICGILIGALGIHKFILGYQTEGIIMLLVTILTCGLGGRWHLPDGVHRLVRE
jgi:TM2 domain-containing membrane protein YozV|tara:strand:+ start:1274 stop:1477 length:204 start_codon:yes stop_codon:yes gene_type:complete